MKDAAIQLATLGYHVFPCMAGTKRPATAHGFKDATTDAEQIEKWWQLWPDANVAIPTAELLVVDIDPDGINWLANEPDKRLELTSAPTVRTPRGGLHHYFRQPDGRQLKNSAGKLAPGVDTRATGGYVLTPPSIVEGKPYVWLESLDEPERLPLPPDWLAAMLDAATRPAGNLETLSPAGSGNGIPEGQRNGTLARLAGAMRRYGMSEPEIAAALLVANSLRCNPPLDADEVRKIARSIAKLPPDQISTAVVENHAGQDGLDGITGGMHEWITSAELHAKTDRIEYAIDDVLPMRQGGMIGGRYKSLKTGIGIDIGISTATGSPFLNRFNVSKPLPTGIMSAESGWPTLRERGIAIAHSKGLELADCSKLFWSTSAPQLARREHLDALRRFIDDKALEVLLVDPLYLAMAGVSDKASNVLAMGELLWPITRMIEQSGCSIILMHHARKHRGQFAEQFGPPELGELSFAGFAEWARFWILLAQRRNWDADAGRHWLWLSTGGSAGHAGLWHLDVTEGKPGDDAGRRWEATVTGAAEGQRQAKAAKELMKDAAKREQVAADKQAIVEAVRKLKDFDTQRGIRDRMDIRPQRFLAAFNELREQGAFDESFIKKNGHLYDGFKLRPEFSLTIAV